MLAIRMQRLGRKGHPTYRVVVQDARQTPTSGKYVAMLGSYDPHSKTNTLIKDKAEFYLSNGAQPSDRVVRLFTSEGINLPSWVKQPSEHARTIRHTEKLRRNRPIEAKPAAEEPVEDTTDPGEPENTKADAAPAPEPKEAASAGEAAETSDPDVQEASAPTPESETTSTESEPEISKVEETKESETPAEVAQPETEDKKPDEPKAETAADESEETTEKKSK